MTMMESSRYLIGAAVERSEIVLTFISSIQRSHKHAPIPNSQ